MLSVISLRGCDYMFLCICVLHVDQRVACQCNSTATISQKWAICRMLPPTTRLSSVFQFNVTITVERQTHRILSNDPLYKSIHSECCRGTKYIDAIIM